MLKELISCTGIDYGFVFFYILLFYYDLRSLSYYLKSLNLFSLVSVYNLYNLLFSFSISCLCLKSDSYL